MGLLGDDDTQMAIAQGLLSGRGSLGLAAALANVRGVEDTRFKRSQQQMQMQQQQMQMEAARQAMMDEQRRREYIANLPDPQATANQQALAGGGGPTMANASRATVNPAIQALYQGVRAGAIPVGEYLKSFAPAELPMNKIDPKDFTPESLARFAQTRNYGDLQRLSELQFVEQGGGFLPVNKFTGQAAAAAIPKTGDPFKDLLLTGPNGGMVPNQPLIGAKVQVARAGASNINNQVSVAGPENEYNKVIGKGLADAGLALVEAAKIAPEVISNAQSIRKAIAAGAITGTGAEPRLVLQKALETAGLVGEGKAASTQELMSSLGRITFGGIKTSGLGSNNGFTDKDREFLQSAISGTIDATPQNLLRVANLSERVARANYEKGASVLGRWKEDKALGAVAQDTQLDPLPMAAPKPTLRFNPKTGKLEQVQ